MNPPSIAPDAILQTAFGFWDSKVLLTAVEFGVFTTLGERRLTGAELGGELGLHPRGIADFFDALVAMKFLDREGDGADAKYFNTPAGALYLDRRSPRYIGGILEMLNARLFKFWHDLPEALRTGQPAKRNQARARKNIFEELYAEPAEARTIPRRHDRPLAHQLRGARREVRFLALPDAVRRRRRDRPCSASKWRKSIRTCAA